MWEIGNLLPNYININISVNICVWYYLPWYMLALIDVICLCSCPQGMNKCCSVYFLVECLTFSMAVLRLRMYREAEKQFKSALRQQEMVDTFLYLAKVSKYS